MNVLLIRPDPGNERFGLGPFFRVEPLGMEYIAAGLARRGHEVTILDLRFRPGLGAALRRARPRIVGIAAMHALEFDQVLDLARRMRRLAPEAFIVVGGHAAAAYPVALEDPAIDAIATDDGEETVPALAAALEEGRPPSEVPALRLRTAEGFVETRPLAGRTGLDVVALPDRRPVARYRSKYHCLIFKPVWALETARGCPFRCSFCSVWQLYDRSFRERSIGAVVEDWAAVGPNLFVVDDLFWNHPERSRELARAIRRRGLRKRWILVQSRCDLVVHHPELLEEWRSVAEDIDIFFGLEAASNDGLAGLSKDATTNESVEAAAIARSMGYQVTGNFVVDPDWEEDQFQDLWEFVRAHGFERAGYTILTPLPGTNLFEQMRPLLEGQPWFKYDMHHVLWEPRLGARRFFELYAETWRRSMLNLSGQKRWTDWARQIRPLQLPYLTRVLARTQRMMKAGAYLREHELGVRARAIARNTDLPPMSSAGTAAPASPSSDRY